MIAETKARPTTDPITAPRWMNVTLRLAAWYNLLWGAFAIIAPMTIFRWAGFDPLPAYPELWQCVGMIVGVYGVGYAIAATDPYRHWPIVLVGFLGKIFGPIGFLFAVINGRFPASMGWTILTNDLVWWVPFGLILWRAARVHQATAGRLSVSMPEHPLDPMGRIFSQYGSSLTELSRNQPVLVVFLRHSGCTFCREALADLARVRSEIEEAGTAIALVHMGRSEPSDLLEKNGLADLHCFRDPNCALYETFGLEMGSFRQLFGFKVIFRGIYAAFFGGHGVGQLDGNGFRMPGVFLVHRSEVVRSYRHDSAADRPNYAALAKLKTEDAPTATATDTTQRVPSHEAVV